MAPWVVIGGQFNQMPCPPYNIRNAGTLFELERVSSTSCPLNDAHPGERRDTRLFLVM
jgi:hypothetical protein